MSDPRRHLPSVDRLLGDARVVPLLARAPRAVVVAAIREVLDQARTDGGQAPSDWAQAIGERLDSLTTPSLRPVLNATGIVLHTNLGRAPLAPEAIAAVIAVSQGYSALEFDLETGRRGSRGDHCAPLLAELTGAQAGFAVNNAASALVLALNALAAGREVLISRGELIEIGGSFRIPDILEKSGALLREVGTTNRTHLDDYRKALSDRTGAVLVVHRSNFEQSGFVATPTPAAIAELARERGVPSIHDLGSGLLMDLAPWGLQGEPLAQDAVRGGADLVIFSGDKLLGGPQAGCLVGSAELVARCRKNPHARAARADKMTLAALEATLVLYRDPATARERIPVLAMLTADPAVLAERSAAIRSRAPAAYRAQVVPGESAVGGGSFPTATLPTALVSLDPGPAGADRLAGRLRAGRGRVPPLVARIADGRVLLDPRTLPPGSLDQVVAALESALS